MCRCIQNFETMAMKLFFAVVLSLLFFCEAMPNYDVKLSDVFFEGGFVFFPVKRTKLQDRLDEINSYFENEVKSIHFIFDSKL